MRTPRIPATVLLALLTLTSGAAASWAPPGDQGQAAQLTGRVVDAETGQPLVSAQVYVAGTSYGTITDERGRYLLAGVHAGTYAVEVRLIGYAQGRRENVRVPASGTVTLDFNLRVTALALDAVIVTGVVAATSARRVPFTVARVGAADLQVPAENAVNAIQGKVAGVNVVASAQPGTGTNILLRTPTSINKSTAPLFVVDGVILASTFGASSADLDALDVESVEIIKGAAAASLYGSRAANGVVQIRTKRGANLAQGETRIQLRSEIGLNQLGGRIEKSSHYNYLVNSAGQYVDAVGNVVDRAGRVERPESERYLDVAFPGPVYDHVDQFFDPGTFMQTSVSISQNSGSTNFLASFANHQIDGVLLEHGGYDRNDLRFNLDHRLRSNLSLSLSGYHMRSDRELLPAGDVSGAFFQLVQQAPDLDLLQDDPDGTPYIFQPDPIEPSPLYNLYWRDETEERARTLGNLNLRYTPISWFSIDGDFSYDRSDRAQRYYFPRGKKTETQSQLQGYLQRGSGLTTAMNGSISANLLANFGDLVARLTGRALAEREEYEFFEAETANLAVEGVPDLDAGTAPLIGQSYENIKSEGYFLTTDLDYQGKYIANALVRRDGSSLFGPEQRWHTYYRGSFAYRMAEEPWWPVDWLTEFKLRYSIGTAGGRPSFDDQYETYSFNEGGTLVKGTLGNSALKPERAREQEIGLDAVLFDRVSVQINYAKQKTEDQLILIPLPAPFGFSSQWQNAGTVEGNTWEGTIQAQLIATDETRFSIGLVTDRSRHEITEFDRACFRTGTDNLTYRCAGETLGVMYGHSFAHSASDLPSGADPAEFQVNDEGLLVWVGPTGSWRDASWGQSTTFGGRTYKFGLPFLLLDSTGSSAVRRIGDSNPDFHLGVNGNLQWKNFSLYGLFDMQFGGDIYNRTNQRMYQYFRSADADQAGRSEELKKTTDYYLALYAANLINDRFVEDASFIKLREVALRYQVPRGVLSSLRLGGIHGLQLGLVGRNLFTMTDYSGYDPEVGTPLLRMDDFVYPQYRTITASIQIDFSMLNARRQYMRRLLKTLAVTALLAGCQDLDVVNPNEPDRNRVTGRPDDVESLIASSFRLWLTIPQDEYPSIPLAAMADNITGGFFDYGVFDVSTEPRSAWNNSSLNTRDGTNRLPWYDTYRSLSSVNDGLYALDQGLNLDGTATPGTRTRRALAFGKLVQGLSTGYLALMFHKAFVVTEHTDLTALDPINGFEPYTAVRDSAIRQLDDAIAAANQGSFTIPADINWVNGVELTNQAVIRLANSFAARFMVYNARTPAERAAVNWTEVIRRVDAGITADLAPLGALDIVEGNYRRLLARVRTRPGDHIRPDMMLLGPADVSGGFQTWLATPMAQRQPWQMNTPDKRIVGATQSAVGKYFGYNRNSIWATDRGTFRFSWYYYLRSGAGESWYTGPQPTMTRTEMDLLKAEGLIRLNRAAEAIPLINNSRVANGELPPITTVDGPPEGASCVPRKFNGQCGSLWDALRYEKNIELTGIEGGIAWYDARGWGALAEGTPIHFPVPGRELDNLGLATYTFGGVGGQEAAPAPNPEKCPVALPRCPA